MANVGLVQVAEGVEGLLHDHSCLGLSEVLFLGDVVEEFSSFA